MVACNRLCRLLLACRRRSVQAIATLLGISVCMGLVAIADAQATKTPKPEIVDRKTWGAKPPILKRMKRQTPREIIIHHTGVRQQPKITLERKLRGLQGYSQGKKPWGDSPYHYYIGVSGRIGEARDVAYAGDTNTKYSVQDRIQVVVEGHFDRNTPTPGQLASLDALVVWLADIYDIKPGSISAHNDHAQTDCPGKRLKPHLETLRKHVRQQLIDSGKLIRNDQPSSRF